MVSIYFHVLWLCGQTVYRITDPINYLNRHYCIDMLLKTYNEFQVRIISTYSWISHLQEFGIHNHKIIKTKEMRNQTRLQPFDLKPIWTLTNTSSMLHHYSNTTVIQDQIFPHWLCRYQKGYVFRKSKLIAVAQNEGQLKVISISHSLVFNFLFLWTLLMNKFQLLRRRFSVTDGLSCWILVQISCEYI